MSMYFPKRDELSLRMVRALPNDSRIGFDCRTCCSMHTSSGMTTVDESPWDFMLCADVDATVSGDANPDDDRMDALLLSFVDDDVDVDAATLESMAM